MKKFLLCFAVLLSFIGTGRAAGESGRAPSEVSADAKDVVVEERKMPSFNALQKGGSFPVTYIQSSVSKIVVEGNSEHVARFVSEVRGGTLKLEMMRGKYKNLSIRVTVYSPELDRISISGNGSFYDLNGHKSRNDIEVRSSGNCSFELGKMECKSLSIHSAGSGRVTAESIVCGNADFSTSGSGKMVFGSLSGKSISMSSSGSGSLTVSNLKADELSVRMAGSGFGLLDKADILGDLRISISGSGSVKINGKAGDVDASISGSGSVMGDLKHNHLSVRTSGSGKVKF